MKLCRIIGCKCGGLHNPRKAYEGGYTYYAAWYGPRYSDGSVCISLVPGKAEQVAKESAAFDIDELCHYVEDEDHKEVPCDEYGCPYCDIISGMEFAHKAKDLFTAAELREHRRDLLAGKVVILRK